MRQALSNHGISVKAGKAGTFYSRRVDGPRYVERKGWEKISRATPAPWLSLPFPLSCWEGKFPKPTILLSWVSLPGAAFGTHILSLYLANIIILNNSSMTPPPISPSCLPMPHLNLSQDYLKDNKLELLVKVSPLVLSGSIQYLIWIIQSFSKHLLVSYKAPGIVLSWRQWRRQFQQPRCWTV